MDIWKIHRYKFWRVVGASQRVDTKQIYSNGNLKINWFSFLGFCFFIGNTLVLHLIVFWVASCPKSCILSMSYRSLWKYSLHTPVWRRPFTTLCEIVSRISQNIWNIFPIFQMNTRPSKWRLMNCWNLNSELIEIEKWHFNWFSITTELNYINEIINCMIFHLLATAPKMRFN